LPNQGSGVSDRGGGGGYRFFPAPFVGFFRCGTAVGFFRYTTVVGFPSYVTVVGLPWYTIVVGFPRYVTVVGFYGIDQDTG
jgi:hypothetical protein